MMSDKNISKKVGGGIAGRPPIKINIYLFNLFLNTNMPYRIIMEIFGMSRGTFFRYKKLYFTKLELKELPFDKNLLEEQKILFEKYAYQIVDRYSERLWAKSEIDDYKQECYLRIWSGLGQKAIKGFVAYCNRICELVLKETIIDMAKRNRVLFYDDNYYENSNGNKLDKYFSVEEEYI